jgi:hypothetical protein
VLWNGFEMFLLRHWVCLQSSTQIYSDSHFVMMHVACKAGFILGRNMHTTSWALLTVNPTLAPRQPAPYLQASQTGTTRLVAWNAQHTVMHFAKI